MKVLTWNINGIRSVVNKAGSIKALLESLDADIICFQETKLRRSELDRELAVVEGWESFWNFSTNKTGPGYAGVATYCRTATASTPVAVEHGLTGAAAMALPGKPDGSSTSCSDTSLTLREALGLDQEQLAALDSEGRVVITDHGPFLLVNLYGPALTSEERVEERLPFKLNFYQVLEVRLCQWLAAGRGVLLMGDFNISPQPVDSCKPHPIEDFQRRPDRVWLNKLLGPHGPGVADVFRMLHPARANAYTCWNTASGARVHNYGTRIDHILAAGLLPDGLSAPSNNATAFSNSHSRSSVAPAVGTSPQFPPAAATGSRPATGVQAIAAVGAAAKATQPPGIPAARFACCITGCDIMHDFEGSDHAPVWAELAIPVQAMPSGHAAPAAAGSRMFPGKQASLKAWLRPKQQQQQEQCMQLAPEAAKHMEEQPKTQQLVTLPQEPSAAASAADAAAGAACGSSSGRQASSSTMRLDSNSSSSGGGSSLAKRKRDTPAAAASSQKRGQTSLLSFMRQAAAQQQQQQQQQASTSRAGDGAPQATSSCAIAGLRQQGNLQQPEQERQVHAAVSSDNTSGHILSGGVIAKSEQQQQQQRTQQSQQSQRSQAAWPPLQGQGPGLLQQYLPQPRWQQQQQPTVQQPGNRTVIDHDAAASVQQVLADQQKQAVEAWQRISKAMQPPKCMHGEVCVVRTCKKQNDNFMRQFYCCARPDGPFPGPGRCSFFKWVTEPKKTKGASAAAAQRSRS